MGRGIYRNYYKGHMDKTKGEGGGRGGKWIWLGWGGGVGRKMQTNIIEQQLKKYFATKKKSKGKKHSKNLGQNT